MTLDAKLGDRVKESTTTTGTGTIALGGAVAGFASFLAGVGNGQYCYYAIVHRTAPEWEVGRGGVIVGGTLLSRDTVYASSNGGALVNFSAGTKDAFVTIPAKVFDLLYPLGAVAAAPVGGVLTLPNPLWVNAVALTTNGQIDHIATAGVVNGMVVTIRCPVAGTPFINASSGLGQLLLLNRTNYTAAQDDVIVFAYNGSLWLEVGRYGYNLANAPKFWRGDGTWQPVPFWKDGGSLTAAATLPLPNPLTGNLYTVFGNTTITSISQAGIADGTVVYLRFADLPTVQHSATLQLAGAANFTAFGGETLTMLLASGAWREINRTFPPSSANASKFWRGDGTWRDAAPVKAATLAITAGVVTLPVPNDLNHISVGNGAITRIDPGPAPIGTMVWLTFTNGGNVLTNFGGGTGQLFLMGNQNYTTQAYDRILFGWDGTVWVELIRQPTIAAANVTKFYRGDGSWRVPQPRITIPTYGASIAIDASLADTFLIKVTNATAFTIANPTNPTDGQVLRIWVRNQSGGAHGTITLGSAYKTVGGVSGFPVVANGFNRTVTYAYDASAGAWYEQQRGATDVPN